MLRLTSLTTALLLGALPACYAETAKPEPKSPGIVVTLWPKGAMPGQAGKGTERILPARGDAVVRLTDICEPSFTVYQADSAKPAPAVIVSPGGGYGGLAVVQAMRGFAKQRAAQRINAHQLAFQGH